VTEEEKKNYLSEQHSAGKKKGPKLGGKSEVTQS